MAVAKAGDDRAAPDRAGTHVKGGTEELSCFARNGCDPGAHSTTSKWGGLSQGMKVSQSRCGNKSEAKPFPGQTCPIEPADGVGVTKRDMMAGRSTSDDPLATTAPRQTSMPGPRLEILSA